MNLKKKNKNYWRIFNQSNPKIKRSCYFNWTLTPYFCFNHMRSIFTTLFIFLFAINNNDCLSQFQEFNQQRHEMDKRLMLGLGSWASLNLVGSGIGWAVSTNESTKYFHQMNVMWNAVNLGLSIPAYIKAHRGNNRLSFFETMNDQRKTETVFLINAGLDLAYISSGLLLKNKPTQDPNPRRSYFKFRYRKWGIDSKKFSYPYWREDDFCDCA